MSGFSIYAYANPTVYVDPDGNQTKIYKHVDDGGNVFYNNTPPAERVGNAVYTPSDASDGCAATSSCFAKDKADQANPNAYDKNLTVEENPKGLGREVDEIEEQRKRLANAAGDVNRVISTAGDVVEVLTTMDEESLAASMVGGSIGYTASKLRKIHNKFKGGKNNDASDSSLQSGGPDHETGYDSNYGKGDPKAEDSVAKGGRNLPFKDKDRVTEINKTLDRIDGNGPFPHKRDGITFKNREGKLPDGNYKEYTVDTPGASNRGARRVVRDQDTGNTYYTDDHYKNFIQIDPTKN